MFRNLQSSPWCNRPSALILLTVLVAVSLPGQVLAAEETQPEIRQAGNLDELLQLVEERKLHWSQRNEQRERTFQQARSDQQRLLREAQAERRREEALSDQLETQYEENERTLAGLQEQLDKRLGSLRELFGVLQQVAGDARGVFSSSIVSAQLPNRGEWLDALAKKMGTSTELATIEEIERLWFELQREMTETGKVVRFPGTVVETDGQQRKTEVVRVGAFNLVADEEYVNYNISTQSIVALPRQPSARFRNTARELSGAEPGVLVPFGLDPTRGSLLSLLIQSKTLGERVEDGGAVGYVIITLGTIGVLLAILQFAYLSLIGIKVSSQRQNPEEPGSDNPLGRILKIAKENRSVDVETLELKMSEAILGETPRLSRFLAIIQVISVVSPLLGLLGTVIGMILTFQAITLFGTGDPQTMAGGISTALMTTVLGLCAAIPTVLLHSVVSSRSKALIHVLEEQSAGIVAEQAEQIGHASGQDMAREEA